MCGRELAGGVGREREREEEKENWFVREGESMRNNGARTME